jgi:predicted membrane-bound mannosyltransferase
MKIFKMLSGLTWFYFIFVCVVVYYDYRKNQLTWENITLLVPLIVLIVVDCIEYRRRDRNVNNDWSKRL